MFKFPKIKKSIQEFGNNDPIAIDENSVIIEGHGRYEALKELGFNRETIKGVIDPVQGIFSENSIDRVFLTQAGIRDFDKAKEIFLSKKDEIEKIYTNVLEKIILQTVVC